jgi:hypothetical protein
MIHQTRVSSFSAWIFPIRPVMYSRCLSADGFRFSGLPFPTGECGARSTAPPHGASIFVSVRDIVQIFELCINADDSLRFDIFGY